MSHAGLALLALIWSAAVWGGAGVLTRLNPSPSSAQTIWRAAAGLLLLPFAASLIVPAMPSIGVEALPDLPALEPIFIVPGEGTADAAAPGLRLPATGAIIFGLISAGWAVRFAFWIAGQYRLQRLKALSRRVSRPAGHWAEALGLTRTPEVRVIPRGAPFLAGIRRPTVFVPSALIEGADAGPIIVHEMVHLKRGDLAARPLERLVADIFWFSPFAWAIRSELDYWREAVVDEQAASLTGDRIAYARALTRAARLARPVTPLPVAAFILKKEGTLKMRLNLLLTDRTKPRRLGLAAALLLACAAPLAIAQGLLIKGAAPTLVTGTTYTHPVLEKAKLTSSFGERKHPVTGELKLHRGVDLAEEEGKPVYAPAAGSIVRADFSEGYGNFVDLAVPAGHTLRFAQLQEIRVAAGDQVGPGATLGTLGQTGQATGPHLHLEVWRDGKPVDPELESGLVLAETLNIAAGARPLVLLPAVAPVAPAPAPVAPAPASAPAFVPAAPVPQTCHTLSKDLRDMLPPAGWDARRDAAREANKAAGLSGKDVIPKAISHPRPAYPPEAAAQKMSAACDVMFDLGTDGLPRKAVSRCTNDLFESEAGRLPGAVFEPVLNASGQAVEVKGIVYPLLYCVE